MMKRRLRRSGNEKCPHSRDKELSLNLKSKSKKGKKKKIVSALVTQRRRLFFFSLENGEKHCCGMLRFESLPEISNLKSPKYLE